MVKFIIVRHGYSVANEIKKFSGQTDVPLTEKGYLQAEITAKYLTENFSVDSIYSSDLSRAYNTVKPLSDALGLDITKRKDFREIDVGLWQGKSREEAKEAFPETFNLYTQNKGITKFDGGESYLDVICRVKKAIEEIAEENEGKTVVIATHGGVIRALQAAWCDNPLEVIHKFPVIENCSVSICEYSDNKLRFITTGYTEHLANNITKYTII